MDIFRRKKFNEAMFAKNRTLAIRVGQYQSRDIKEASFDYGYIKGDAYKPGGTCAGSGKITFTSIITTFNKLDKIYPEIGLLVDGTYEWVKMGEYFINDIEIDRNRNTTTLDLMDGMFKLNREHITSLTYPAEIRHVIKEICLKTGIELANENMDISSMNYQVEKIPSEKKMTFRDVLSLASQMLGMSCFFNREGKLEIKELTDSGIVITADSYFMHGLTKSEIEYQIAGITCKKDKETLTVGMRTGRSLELDNLFMSQVILDNLYHKIKDIRYYPFNLNFQGHLLLEVGQWVTIKTNKGETFKSPVLSQSFNFKGGLRGRISADSKAGNDAQYSYAGTLTKKIEQFNEFEAQIQNQIEEADKGFDQKVEKIKKDFSNQVELAKAKAEEVKRQLSDTIDQRFNSFDTSSIAEANRKAEEALEKSGANTSLIDEALSIGRKTRMRLDRLKRDFESTGEITNNILGEIDRNLKKEINTTSEYRRTTNEMLSRMTGQMNGFATKSEVKQDIDGLTQTFAKMKVGGRNYAEDYDFSRGLWQYSQGDSSPQDWTILNGEYNVKGTTSTWKQMQIHSKEGSKTSGKNSTALLDLEIGETYTLSFQGICYSGSPNVWVSLRANRTAPGNPEIMYGNFNLTSSWQTYQVTIPSLTKPDNFDFWRIILGYSEIGHVAFRKVELTRSSTRIDAGPAPEDGKTDLVAAKSEFQGTAEGLSSKMTAVERYVNQDGQRQEALQRYAREESAKQVTAVRELVTRDYVGKATYQEDVRGINQRIEEAKKNASNELTTRLANYRQTVDGKFTDISSQVTTYKQVADGQIANLSRQVTTNKNSTDQQINTISGQVSANKANVDNQIANLSNQLAKKVEITDFQRVRETSQLYERILGTTEQGLPDKVSRLVMSSSIFQTEVGNFFVSDNNLIVNSETLDKNTLVNQRSGVSLGPQNGIFAINAVGLTSFNWSGFTLPIYIPKILKGEVYTLSFKYKIKRKLDHEFYVAIKNHVKNKAVLQKVVANPSDPISSDWIEFQATSTMNEDFDFGTSKYYPLYFFLVQNGYVEIKEPMLVRGARISSYKPSQFDEAYRATENAKQLAENAQAKAVQVAEQVNQAQQTAEATRTRMNQLAGSWAVLNLTSAGSIVSQINATNNQILIEAEKIRLKGKTLLDELTAIQGYFKRLFVGEGTFATLNTDILRANSITADKLVMDQAMARRFVSSDIFTDTLAAKEAFINKLRSVVVSATLLEGYKGRIGGFQIGTHQKDPSVYWITGQDQFAVGMSNGSGKWGQTALWVNWGWDWNKAGPLAWYVKHDGTMYCNSTAYFKYAEVSERLFVDGDLVYRTNNGLGFYNYSPIYQKIDRSNNYLYLYYNKGNNYDWIPMNREISDRRYKHNIEASTVSGLDVIENLKTYSYRKEYDGKIEDIACGIMAQDVQKYVPEAFYENPDGAYSYRTFELVPYLIKAIQELNQKIKKLEKTA